MWPNPQKNLKKKVGIYHEKTIWLTLLLPVFDFLQQKKYIDGETIILFTGGNDYKCILSMKPSIHKC